MGSTCRRALLLAMLVGTASLLFEGCKASKTATSRPTADWDKVAFALQLVRDEYGEQIEAGDFSGVTALATVLDSAIAALGHVTDETRPVASALGELRASLLRHAPPRTVAKTCARVLTDLARAGRLTRRPPILSDLRRGAASYAVACAPCHGPPNGPLPPAAAHMLPQPTKPNATLQTPYEIFNASPTAAPARRCLPSPRRFPRQPLGHRLLPLRQSLAPLHAAPTSPRSPPPTSPISAIAISGKNSAGERPPASAATFAELPDPTRSRRSTRRDRAGARRAKSASCDLTKQPFSAAMAAIRRSGTPDR